jgi:hypothetical protein
MIGRVLRTTALVTASFAALSAPAFAVENDWGAGIEVMADEEMGDLRGGFEVGGVSFDFGAIITSTMDGVPVLTTQLTWTDAGAIVDQTMSNIGQNIDDMSPEAREALGLDGLDGGGGVVIQDEQGVTAFVHNVTESSLQNIIVNSATGHDLGQDIDVTLTLPGFEAIQGSLLLERFGLRIDEDLRGVTFGHAD